MSGNLKLYNAIRSAPSNALKPITAGRLKGKNDINPMWRLKSLTEQFGPCGVGWKYVITNQWLEEGGNGEIAAFCNIDLFIKWNDEWSEAIPGTGGASFVANEKNGPYVSDECYKMALTDAISVACKALGMAADVYWESDKTKYDRDEPEKPEYIDKNQVTILKELIKKTGTDAEKFLDYYKVNKPEQLTNEHYGHALRILKKKIEGDKK